MSKIVNRTTANWVINFLSQHNCRTRNVTDNFSSHDPAYSKHYCK